MKHAFIKVQTKRKKEKLKEIKDKGIKMNICIRNNPSIIRCHMIINIISNDIYKESFPVRIYGLFIVLKQLQSFI